MSWLAVDAADAGVTAPLWLVILLAVVAVVGPIISSIVTARSVTKTAKDEHTLASSKNDRDLLLEALALARSADPQARRHGLALLEGLAAMPGLSPDDAVLITQVTRPGIEATLSKARRATEVDKVSVRFVRFFRGGGGQ